MSKKDEIEQVKAAPLNAELDMSQFAEYSGMGTEVISAAEMVLPKISILQSISPQVTAEEPLGRAGDIFNSATMENYGRKLEFITLSFWMSRIKNEDAKNFGSPMECSSADGVRGFKFGDCSSCQFRNWHGKNPPECTDYKNLLILPRSADNFIYSPFVVYSAKKTAIKSVNRFLTSLKMLKQGNFSLPMFASIWTMKTEAIKGGKATYYVPSFERTGFISNDMMKPLAERYQEFMSIRQETAAGLLKTQADELDPEETSVSAEDSGFNEDEIPF